MEKDDNIPRRAYPQDRGNGNGKPRRGRGRPPGIPNPKGGRKKGQTNIKTKIDSVVTKECKDILVLKARAITEAVLQEEMRLAFSDVRLIPGCPDGIPDEIAYAIQSFEIDERVIKSLSDESDKVLVARKTKFTLWPKGAALERLSRHLGLYEQDNKQKSNGEQRPQINLFLEQGNVLVQGQLPGPEANGYEKDYDP